MARPESAGSKAGQKNSHHRRTIYSNYSSNFVVSKEAGNIDLNWSKHLNRFRNVSDRSASDLPQPGHLAIGSESLFKPPQLRPPKPATGQGLARSINSRLLESSQCKIVVNTSHSTERLSKYRDRF